MKMRFFAFFLLSLYTFPAFATLKTVDYCSVKRIRAVFGADNTIEKDVPGWVSQRLEWPFEVSDDMDEIVATLQKHERGKVIFSPADERFMYEDIEQPAVISLGKKSYMILTVGGSGECVTIDIAKKKGGILHVKNFIDLVCTHHHYDRDDFEGGSSIDFGYINKKHYMYWSYYEKNTKNASSVELYSLENGNIRKICKKTYTLSADYLKPYLYVDH
ncbi:hypothetical protein PT283_03495 [Acetobacteraceae bacterium ESL0697]|nr:hypothetical protein [Acetobacteraceae bacterium ESL0697]